MLCGDGKSPRNRHPPWSPHRPHDTSAHLHAIAGERGVERYSCALQPSSLSCYQRCEPLYIYISQVSLGTTIGLAHNGTPQLPYLNVHKIDTSIRKLYRGSGVLPVHNKWTTARLRLAEHMELRGRQKLRSYLGAIRAIRDSVFDIHYWKATFVFTNLDELRHWIDLVPTEARNQPISIEVGLWEKAPATKWAMAESLNIQHLTLVIPPNTSMNIS